MNVTLTDEFRDFVRQKVESGEFPTEEAVLQEALRRFRRAEDPECAADEEFASADPIDYDAIAYCCVKPRARTCLRSRRSAGILSKVPGSMAQAVAEEREGRS